MGIISKFQQYRNNEKRKAKKKVNEKPVEKEMTFLEHVEELRWHLIRSFVVIGFIGVFVFIYRQWILDVVILAPFSPDFPLNSLLCRFTGTMCEPVEVMYIAYGPFEQFLTAIKLGFVGGFIVAFPYVLWEFWSFIKPGLHSEEKNRFRGGVFVLSFLFFMGLLFAYYVISPFSVQFLGTFQLSEQVANQWRIGEVISVMTQIPMAGGIMFELPVFVYVFSKMGLLTPEIMKTYRRHAIVVLLVLSAILTPPDVTSQVLIFIPLFILYQVSIVISARVNRQREKELMGDSSGNDPNPPSPKPPEGPKGPEGSDGTPPADTPASSQGSSGEDASDNDDNDKGKDSEDPQVPYWKAE